jgi:hypothetical protein
MILVIVLKFKKKKNKDINKDCYCNIKHLKVNGKMINF